MADYDRGLKHERGHIPKRNFLLNRGNSKFALKMFVEANEDFEAASSAREGSDVALAVGNCQVMLGDFEHARRRYVSGASGLPENSAAHCRRNAEQVTQILEILESVKGHDHRIRQDGLTVYVEAACRRARFPFAGNRGNVGNVGIGAAGGEGYGGMPGFAVIVGPPST